MKMNAMDHYYKWVVSFTVVVVPAIAIFAVALLTILKLAGFFPETNVSWMYFFDIFCVIYLIIGLYYGKNKAADNERIDRRRLKTIKIVCCIGILIQWNFISYIFPAKSFWGFAPFFILLMAFFFDELFVIIDSVGIAVSIALSWCILPDKFLPAAGDDFISELILMIVGLVLGIACVNTITIFGGKVLVRELRYISDYDKLTGFMSRRRFDELCDAPEDFLVDSSEGYNAAVMDFDDFKIINDTYGHINGDEVLIRFGKVVSSVACGKDKIYRLGGEEFMFIIPGSLEEAKAMCEKIRVNFKKESFYFNGDEIHVTVTGGLKHFDKLDKLSGAAKEADKVMYQGKNAGKDRIVV